ncbi:MAG TPA: copper resistance protein B [Steroidobacteraceae bacterium]|nr:copper resistance protein B [Steroidobacteraceae bacterium]
MSPRSRGWLIGAVLLIARRDAPAEDVDATDPGAAAPCAMAAAPADPDAASPFGPAVNDQAIYAHVLFDELEGRFGGGSDVPFRWDGEAWVGTDTNRLWIKSEGFAANGEASDGDHELLYDRPVSSYFDMQAGVRYDLDSLGGRGWAALGIEGLAPEFFDVSATVYASDAEHYAAKLIANYDELLTQRWILQPLVELNLYSRPDPERQVAAGLSDLDAGLRLRYEFSRKIAPYIGVVYERIYGPGRSSGPFDTGRAGAWRLAAGLRAWL